MQVYVHEYEIGLLCLLEIEIERKKKSSFIGEKFFFFFFFFFAMNIGEERACGDSKRDFNGEFGRLSERTYYKLPLYLCV